MTLGRVSDPCLAFTEEAWREHRFLGTILQEIYDLLRNWFMFLNFHSLEEMAVITGNAIRYLLILGINIKI